MNNKLAIITLSAASLFSMALPAATYAQDCAGLRWACENKDQLGLQGAGTCTRYREHCGDGVRDNAGSCVMRVSIRTSSVWKELGHVGATAQPADNAYAFHPNPNAERQAVNVELRGYHEKRLSNQAVERPQTKNAPPYIRAGRLVGVGSKPSA